MKNIWIFVIFISFITLCYVGYNMYLILYAPKPVHENKFNKMHHYNDLDTVITYNQLDD